MLAMMLSSLSLVFFLSQELKNVASAPERKAPVTM